ncbi:MAG: ATPase, partial [Desulfobacteraceae bacterium]|nr:ATPase [Desulfobacteraceae bacterium]
MEEIKEQIEQSHFLINSIRNEVAKELVGQTKLVDSL